MSQTAALIGSSLGGDHVPLIVPELFADPSPGAIATALEGLCEALLGSAVERPELFSAGVGCVFGARLRDGRRVVLKLHGPRTSVGYLDAAQAVQRHLASGGFPAPEPLAGPAPFGLGTATAETLLDAGASADAHEPPVRRALAAGLADLVARCRPLVALDALRDHAMTVPDGALWPTPHEPRFDFAATSAGAEWVDEAAAAARAVRDAGPGDWVVGHIDWRVEHVRLAGGEIRAVYDWDSVRIEREPALVGAVAHAFTADWSQEEWRHLPTLEEALAFVADYEAARGAPFSRAERRVIRAALLYTMAYTARCEHSDVLTDMGRRPPRPPSPAAPAPTGALAWVAAHATDLLPDVYCGG